MNGWDRTCSRTIGVSVITTVGAVLLGRTSESSYTIPSSYPLYHGLDYYRVSHHYLIRYRVLIHVRLFIPYPCPSSIITPTPRHHHSSYPVYHHLITLSNSLPTPLSPGSSPDIYLYPTSYSSNPRPWSLHPIAKYGLWASAPFLLCPIPHLDRSSYPYPDLNPTHTPIDGIYLLSRPIPLHLALGSSRVTLTIYLLSSETSIFHNHVSLIPVVTRHLYHPNTLSSGFDNHPPIPCLC
jgi:hypothetical protein